MTQIRGFAVQEGIIRTVQAAVDVYGLKSIPGSDGEVEVLENVPEIARGYKLGDNVKFSCTFNAIFDAEKGAAESSSDGQIVDVEARE